MTLGHGHRGAGDIAVASLGVGPSYLETNPALHPRELIPLSPSSLPARISVSEAARGPAPLTMVVIQIISGFN